MGVLTDFVAVREGDLDALFSSEDPISSFGGIDGKGTDPVSLTSFFSKAVGTEFDASLIDEFEPVRSDDSFERMVLPVPERIRNFIEGIGEDNVAEMLLKWKETEEYRLAGWVDAEAKAFLLALAGYANQHRDRTLFMWISV